MTYQPTFLTRKLCPRPSAASSWPSTSGASWKRPTTVESGQIGALLRREGLYSSHLSTWRRQRDRGVVKGLSPKKRGRKRKDELEREVTRLQRENERLQASLEQAETIIEVQKNSHVCLVWRRRRTGQEGAHDRGSRGVGQERRGVEGLSSSGDAAEPSVSSAQAQVPACAAADARPSVERGGESRGASNAQQRAFPGLLAGPTRN